MKNILFVLVGVIVLTGCISPKSYVDPTFGKTTYNDIQSVEKKYDSLITVEFQRNGKKFDAAISEVKKHVDKTLRATGVINPTSNNSDITIKVIVNNVADLSDAAAKGFGTGLTFGAIGTTVTDYYEITVEYTDSEGSLIKSYKHALHTTIGNEKAPFENVNPTTLAEAFGIVVEQTLLNFVGDMQKSGKFTKVEFSNSNIVYS